MLCYACYNIYYKFSFYDLIHIKTVEYKEENDFILQNYYVPEAEQVVFGKKNNLIIILLESAVKNRRYTEKDTSSYIPQLQKLDTIYQHHEKLINCYGTTWTIAALTAWSFGVPLKLPYGVNGNKYTVENFLPHAVSIWDIIKENGYDLYLYLGSNAHFSGINNLFKHGNFEIHDLNYYDEQKKITKENKSECGIYDFFIYDELYKKYVELREQNKPFVLFMQTLDTHVPGYTPIEKQKYHDIRDSWFDADTMLYQFICNMEKFLDTDPVTILVFGDHAPMGEQAEINLGKPLYTLFVGKNVSQIPKSKLTQSVNPMDIAPTILQAAGARWNNDQFGLGISMFSSDKSFSEKEGFEALDEKLLYYSKFYDSFY